MSSWVNGLMEFTPQAAGCKGGGLLDHHYRKRATTGLDSVMSIANLSPLTCDRQAEFHPVPRLRECGLEG